MPDAAGFSRKKRLRIHFVSALYNYHQRKCSKKEQGPIPALISVFFPLTSDAQKREAAAVNDYLAKCNESDP